MNRYQVVLETAKPYDAEFTQYLDNKSIKAECMENAGNPERWVYTADSADALTSLLNDWFNTGDEDYDRELRAGVVVLDSEVLVQNIHDQANDLRLDIEKVLKAAEDLVADLKQLKRILL